MLRRSLITLAVLMLLPWAGAMAQTPDPSMAITVELGDVSATKLPFIVAAESGIYARNGLAVTQFINQSAADNVRQSGFIVPREYVKQGLAGDINIGGGSPTIVRMTTVANAPQRIILATNGAQTGFHLFVRPGIHSIAELRGKRIGYTSPGSLDGEIFLAIVKRMGWNADKDFSWFSGIAGGDEAAKTNMDGFVGDAFTALAAQKAGYTDLGPLLSYNIPILGSGVNAMKSWLPTHHAAAAAFIKSTVEAQALIKNNKAAAFAAMTKWYGISDPAVLEPIYDQAVLMPAKPYPSVEGLAVVRSVYSWRELQVHDPSYFLDPSFVAELDKSGYIDSLYK